MQYMRHSNLSVGAFIYCYHIIKFSKNYFQNSRSESERIISQN